MRHSLPPIRDWWMRHAPSMANAMASSICYGAKSVLPNLRHYEVHRSIEASFTPSAATLVATVEPGSNFVERLDGLWLETHVRYFYRIRAVDAEGFHGAFSGEFSAWMREPLPTRPRAAMAGERPSAQAAICLGDDLIVADA